MFPTPSALPLEAKISSADVAFLKNRYRSFVSFIYLSTYLAAIQCSILGISGKESEACAACEKSGRVDSAIKLGLLKRLR